MPAFKPSSGEEFSARSVLGRDSDPNFNIDYDAQVANQVEHVDEFVTYQQRSDIESRTSILEREQAQPGSINWRAQVDGDGNLENQHEVTPPNPHEPTPPGP